MSVLIEQRNEEHYNLLKKYFDVFFDLNTFLNQNKYIVFALRNENELIGIHFNYLKDLCEKKILFLAGRTVHDPMTDKDFGIAIIETETEAEALSYMENDPAVKGNLMYAELFDFSLALLRK